MHAPMPHKALQIVLAVVVFWWLALQSLRLLQRCAECEVYVVQNPVFNASGIRTVDRRLVTNLAKVMALGVWYLLLGLLVVSSIVLGWLCIAFSINSVWWWLHHAYPP